MKGKLNFFIPFGIAIVSIPTVEQWSNLPIGNLVFWWIIYFFLLYFFLSEKRKLYDDKNNINIMFIKLFLFWNLLCIVRGIFVANNYWEWKFLFHWALVLMLPLSIYTFTNAHVVQKILIIWLKVAFPLFFLLLYFLQTEAFGRYLVPISFLLLFFPVFSPKWKAFLLVVLLFVVFSDLSARSNVIKFLIPLVCSSIYYFRNYITIWFLGVIRIFLFFIPAILLILAASDIFNVFHINEYISGQHTVTKVSNTRGGQEEESLTEDTRSFIYIEVITSALKNSYVIMGRTPAKGYDSKVFGDFASDVLKTDTNQRYESEVSILNIFTWTGAIGVILYFLIFYKATYLALYNSRNIYIKIVSIYVTFRWAYAWVEDFNRFDLNNIFLWIMICMCFSVKFREMKDDDFIIWCRGIFEKKYRNPLLVQA